MDTLNGKHVWIIGASSGIGRALALELNKRGARLTLSARRKEELETLNTDLGGKHAVFPLDVANDKDVQTVTNDVAAKFKTIDSIVNLAALYDPTTLDKIEIDATRKMLDVNVMGMFNLIHAALPVLKKQGYGQMALCGSVAGYRGLPAGQPYSATKAAVINLVESLMIENPDLDIKVINPGFVRTPLTDKNDFDMPMIIEPEEAAKALADGMTKKSFEIHFPKKFTYIMNILRILPVPLYKILARKIKR